MQRFILCGLMLVVACAGCEVTPPASAVLAGEWKSTNLDDLEVTLTFDSNGILTKIEATRPSNNATAELSPQNATSDVNSNAVVITIPRSGGAAVYTATLSDDEDTLTGTLDAVIEVETGTITIPQGALVLERQTNGGDPCDNVVCSNGQTCVNGECVADDPCEGVTCDEGQTCVNGECVADDPCEGVTCDEGQTCVNGECVAVDPCEGVTCDEGQTCVDGECIPDELEGDPEAGSTLYAASCQACHGAGGAGGIGPDLRGKTAAELEAGVNEAAIHAALTVSAQDYADLSAYLATTVE